MKFGDAMNKGLTLRMNQCPVKRQWPRLFEHIRNGYLKPSDIVTHRIPLEHIAEGYHMFSSKLDGCIKPHRPADRLTREDTVMAVHPAQASRRRRRPSSCAPASPAGAPTSTRPTARRCRSCEFRDDLTGARWEFPERQPEHWPRERSIEHAFLTPVFGTAQPPHGLSGAIRKAAYRRFSEARTAHWLLLIAADRVDALGAHVGSLLRLHPDDPVTETGVKAELTGHPVSSRVGRGRADVDHQWMDPFVVAGPWVAAGIGVLAVGRRVRRALRD